MECVQAHRHRRLGGREGGALRWDGRAGLWRAWLPERMTPHPPARRRPKQSRYRSVTLAAYIRACNAPEEVGMSVLKRLAGVAAVAGLAAIGVAAMPHDANAW